jgi:Flp pilus assembly pilin Flp
MVYGWMGRMHALLLGLRDERGQGTVEYVGLILLLAGVMAAVITFGSGNADGIAKAVIDKFKNAINDVKAK